MHTAPRWLDRLERYLGWIAIPHISILLITLQVFGFFFTQSDPQWVERLALYPDAVRAGEVWRLVTFLALPLSNQVIWMLFVLWFLYFILNSLENEWGHFRTTFYVLMSWVLSCAFSMTFDYPITQISHFQSTLFLAAAALYPNMQVLLFMIVPVKMRWMAWVTGVFVLIEAARGGWIDRAYLLTIYLNFLLFFGPAALSRLRQSYRKWAYQRKIKG